MPSIIQREFLIGAKFYFRAEGVTERIILKCSQVAVNSKVGGNESPVGCGKYGDIIRQITPTFETFPQLELTLVATEDRTLYEWYAAANQVVKGKTKWAESTGGRRLSWITALNQSGEEVVCWEFRNSYITSYSPPMFDATSSNMAMEKVKYAYEAMVSFNPTQGSNPQGSYSAGKGNYNGGPTSPA
jgi:phage tail-like protein